MASPVPRRKDALAVHSLQRFVFSVPDLAEAAKFYRTFGLDVRETDGRLDLYAFGHPHRWASIYPRPGGKRLEYIALGAYPEDYEAIVARLSKLGVPTTAPHPLADDEGVWITDPEGIAVEIVRADKVSPNGRRDPARWTRSSPMEAVDRTFAALVRANPHLRPRVGNPDEMRSNRLLATLELLKFRVTAPEPDVPEAIDGAVITALNEEAVVCAAVANKGGINLVLNLEDEGFPHSFQLLHGLSVAAMALRVDDPAAAARHATRLLAKPFAGAIGEGELAIPAVRGVGGSLLYFLESGAFVDVDFVAEAGGAADDLGLLAVDHVADGIRVNAVCPGTVDSPWVRRLIEESGESLADLRARQPLGRLGTPDEVADAVLFLLASAFSTGTILTIDGGLTAA